MWTEVHELAALLQAGDVAWDALDLDDVDVRLKWVGLFHRRKRTPGRFMMRVRVPNGELTGAQLRNRALTDTFEPGAPWAPASRPTAPTGAPTSPPGQASSCGA